MYIIPHNRGFIQVTSTSIRHSGVPNHAGNSLKFPVLSCSFLESHVLYDQGLNVFPQPIGAKNGYPWRSLQYTRLSRNHPIDGLRMVTQGACNLAVMCGRTSGNLFVLDCETPDVLAYQMKRLRRRRIPLWVVRTARGGHIYLRSQTGEVASVASGIMQDLEIRGAGGYVLAPPSIHPSGVLYEWMVRDGDHIPVVNPAIINWLKDSKGRKVTLRVTSPAGRRPDIVALSPYSPLSAQTRDYLAHGASLPQGSRNNRLFAAACDMLGCAYESIEVDTLLKPIALASGLPIYEIEATLASAASRSRTPSRPASIDQPSLVPHSQQRYSWRYALLYASLHQWQGVGSSQERALFLAMVERSRVAINEHGVFRASIRELAAMARMGINTVQRILKRWQTLPSPTVFHVGSDRVSGAHTWRFADRIYTQARHHMAHHPDHVIPAHWLHYSEALFTSDAVEIGGVGKSAMFLYSFMQQMRQPAMPSELARLSGLTTNQVNYALLRLRQLALVTRNKRGWCRVEMTLVELTQHVIERRPSIAGRGQRRRALFAEQRAVYATRLLLRARLKREGHQLRSLLMQTLPTVLSRDMMPESVRDDFDNPISTMLFEHGAHCTYDTGEVLHYIPVY